MSLSRATFVGFLFCISMSGACYAATVDPFCQSRLSDQDQVRDLRSEILVANLRNRESERDNSKTSNSIEGRAHDIPTTAASRTHVLSLGSGPDIFLPLYLYPTAKYFHLIDLLGGWGWGPEDVLEEIENRLAAVAPEARVDRLDDLGDWRQIPGMLPSPLIWRVRWVSPTHGDQEKIFFLHQVDFRSVSALSSILAISKDPKFEGGMSGVVLTGVSAGVEVRRLLLKNLVAGGSMFTEMLYTNKDGETSSPDDAEILKVLSSEFHVTDLGLSKLTFMYTPHQFFIAPR